MRALTHADQLMCPHGGKITPRQKAESSKLVIGGQRVLLVEEVKDVDITSCPLGQAKCTKVVAVVANSMLRTILAGKRPIQEGALILTDRGPARVIPSAAAKAWRVGGGPTPQTVPGPNPKTESKSTDHENDLASKNNVDTRPLELAFRLFWPGPGSEPLVGALVRIEPTERDSGKSGSLEVQTDSSGWAVVSAQEIKGTTWLRAGREVRLTIQSGPYLIPLRAVLLPALLTNAPPKADEIRELILINSLGSSRLPDNAFNEAPAEAVATQLRAAAKETLDWLEVGGSVWQLASLGGENSSDVQAAKPVSRPPREPGKA